VNASRCAASTLEAVAARHCQGDRGVDERDVRVFAKGSLRKKVVNVLVEAASDRELRGLREQRELAKSANQKVQGYTRCTH
jgi:hypothetical protein